jgi:hypothetical protein
MTLLIQKYLREGGSLEELKTKHGIYHNITGHKLNLNYDEFESSRTDPLAIECRGLILHKHTFDIIACPFFRFKDYSNEFSDISNCKFLTKVDGSLLIVYYDCGKWHCATRNRPEADQLSPKKQLSFKELFDLAVQSANASDIQDLMKFANIDYTFMFELTTPHNPVVVIRNSFELTLLGLRNNKTLLEELPENNKHIFKHVNINYPKEYHFNNIKEVIEFVRSLNPDSDKEFEGLIIRRPDFQRIKVKNAFYNYLNQNTDFVKSDRRLVEIVLSGNTSNLIKYLPDIFSDKIILFETRINELLAKIDAEYASITDYETDKEFAIQASIKSWPGILFLMKKHKLSCKEVLLTNLDQNGNIRKSFIDQIIALSGVMDI